MNADQTTLKSLMQLLYKHYHEHFISKSVKFIKHSIMFLIEHKLYNKRCKTEYEDLEKASTHRSTVLSSSISTLKKANIEVHTITLTVNLPQDMSIITEADSYAIQTVQILQSEIIINHSSVTVIDVTPCSVNMKKNLFSQLFFKK